jgi:outer membrane protein OmpA-like peptidoglycan-associated protein
MMFLTAGAQENKKFRHANFETNRFIDNWEVSVGVGGQSFYRLHETPDLDLNEGNKISFGFNVAAGKWFTPIFGARVQYQGISMTNAVRATGAENNWNYHYIHADALINLTNWICGYKSDRFYNAVLIGGAGYGLSSSENMEGVNNEMVMTAGLQNRFRLCKSWDANLELKANLTKQGFDNANSGFRFGNIYDVTAGVTYKISNKRDFALIDHDMYTSKIAALEKDVENGNKTIAEGEEEVAKLKKALDKEKKAKEAAMEAERKAKAAYAPTPNQSLSIFFRLGESEISDKNEENLKFLAEAIKASKGNEVFTITGYADRQTGSEEYNENPAIKFLRRKMYARLIYRLTLARRK